VKKIRNSEEMTPEEVAVIDCLIEKIDFAIENLGAKEEGVFIRMSSRSPKDAVIDNADLIFPYIEEEFRGLNDVCDEYECEKALCAALLKAQKIYSGEQAFNLLLFHSSRTRYDVSNALNYKDTWRNSIIVRKWMDIPIDMEFRGFVHQKELTALSQYSHDLYFPTLEDKMPSIVDRIEEFWDQIKDNIPIDDFVVDFLVLEDRIMIVELNPFDAYTGPALFSYRTDIELLLNKPITVKITGLDIYKGLVSASWCDIIPKVRKSIIEENERKNIVEEVTNMERKRKFLFFR